MVSISLRKKASSKATVHRRRSSIEGSQSIVADRRRSSSGLAAADHAAKELPVGDKSPVDALHVSAVKIGASMNNEEDERARQTNGAKQQRRDKQIPTFKFGVPSTPAPFSWFVGPPNGGLALIPKSKNTNGCRRGMF